MKAKVFIDEGAQRVTTTLPDGSEVVAEPSYDKESVYRSQILGYKTPWQMCRDHDRLHCLIADALGWKFSNALYLVAHPEHRSDQIAVTAAHEECLVMLIARLLNEGIDTVMEAHGLAA